MKCLNGWKKSPEVTAGAAIKGCMGRRPNEATAAAAATLIAVEVTHEDEVSKEPVVRRVGDRASSRQSRIGSGSRRGCWYTLFLRPSSRLDVGLSSPSDSSSS